MFERFSPEVGRFQLGFGDAGVLRDSEQGIDADGEGIPFLLIEPVEVLARIGRVPDRRSLAQPPRDFPDRSQQGVVVRPYFIICETCDCFGDQSG